MSTQIDLLARLGTTGAFAVAWPLLVHEYEVPLIVGGLVYLIVGAVLFWFLIRPLVLPMETDPI